ncbi:MAG: ABC transporter permease [Clostridiales Family XIII bacterium]|jgi:ribose/xylose/arabinose/galactoside ABC-type transport system permease subunit|nr:ABC transporter permease [Clostridiales Family XIII bacterium]
MNSKIKQFIGGQWGQRVLILLIIFIVMAIFEPKFFTTGNASSILLAISVYGIMACGMLFVVLIGGLDLSVGSMAGLSAVIISVFASRDNFGLGGCMLGLLAALAAAIFVGYIHGVLVTHIGMQSFVVTLATKYVLYGIVPTFTGGAFIYFQGTGFMFQVGNARPLGIPLPIIIFLLIAVICGIVLSRTTFGRRLYAIGGNPTASALVGVRVFRDTKIAYIVSCVTSAIGGLILCSMNMVAGQTTANNYEGNVLLAMIVGGINLAGGEGGISGAVFGALLAGIITNLMTLLGVSADFQKFVQGMIILAAVILNVYTSRRSAGLGSLRRRRRKHKAEETDAARKTAETPQEKAG